MDGLSAAQVSALAINIRYLDAVAIASRDATKVNALSPAQAGWLTPGQVTALGDKVASLSPKALSGLNGWGVNGLSAAQVSALGSDIASLLPAAISSTGARQVDGLSAAQAKPSRD